MSPYCVLTESWIVGPFTGYAPGSVYRLGDGSEWVQESRTREGCYREAPACRLLTDGTGRTYLDVEGMGSVVVVIRVRRFGGGRSGVGGY